MLYELLAGRLPFEAQSAAALLEKVLNQEPPPPSSFATVAPLLERLAMRALRKDRKDRRVLVSASDSAMGALVDYRDHLITAAVTGQIDVRSYCAEGACP